MGMDFPVKHELGLFPLQEAMLTMQEYRHEKKVSVKKVQYSEERLWSEKAYCIAKVLLANHMN